MAYTYTKGKLEVICGSMFSGKSEELIRRLRRAQLAQLKVAVFKHNLDDRVTVEYITAHTGEKFHATPIEQPNHMLRYVSSETDIIAIDEVQFFGSDIVPIVLDFISMGKRVIVAGLDLDFRGMPFGCMPALLALADCVTKLNAVCMVCGKDAHHTQRLINNEPAKFNDPIILIGAQECYQARCRDCYAIDLQPQHKYTEL